MLSFAASASAKFLSSHSRKLVTRIKKRGGSRHVGKSREPRKVVVTEAQTTGLWRCLVHLFPVLTSTIILIFNFRGHYIGEDFPGPIKSETIVILFLQISAKVQELMIIASLSVIIFQLVRHELLFGDGLPLGLIGAGLSFRDFDYFFSREFYGALKYTAGRGKMGKKIGFVAVILLAGLIAVLAGPASAVLLVPRSQTWPSGGTGFYLNGSSKDFWPDDMSENVPELKKICSVDNSTQLSICPAAGYNSLWEDWSRMRDRNLVEEGTPAFTKRLSGSRFYWPIHSPTMQTPPLFVLGKVRENDDPWLDTFLVQAHAATAIMLNRIGTDWWQALTSQNRDAPDLINDRVIRASTKSPYVSVRCAEPLEIPTFDKTVHFPTLNAQGAFANSSGILVDSLNSTAVDHLRFQWIVLPERYGTSSIGAIYESPWSSNESRVVVGCSTQVRWVPATIYTDKYSFWTGWYPWDIRFETLSPLRVSVPEGQPLLPTNGRIALGEDWLDLLTPPTPAIGPGALEWGPSTIESILDNAGFSGNAVPSIGVPSLENRLESEISRGNISTFLEAIICSVLVDGVSRSGSQRLFQTDGPVSQWPLATYKPIKDFKKAILADQTALEIPTAPSSPITVLHATMEITGFAFKRSLAVYLAASVLLLHLAMATTHTIWVIFKKRTSKSWSTVAELIALSQNSQPASNSLSNTGGGIYCSTTFSRIAKIRVRSQPDKPGTEQVELVFEDSDDSSTRADSSEGWETTAQEDVLIPMVQPSWTWPQDSRSASATPLQNSSGRDPLTGSIEPSGLTTAFKFVTEGEFINVNREYG